jgi:hypothetical protein
MARVIVLDASVLIAYLDADTAVRLAQLRATTGLKIACRSPVVNRSA